MLPRGGSGLTPRVRPPRIGWALRHGTRSQRRRSSRRRRERSSAREHPSARALARHPSRARALRHAGLAPRAWPPDASDSPRRRQALGSARPAGDPRSTGSVPGSHPASDRASRSAGRDRRADPQGCQRSSARPPWRARRWRRCPSRRATPRRSPPRRRLAPRDRDRPRPCSSLLLRRLEARVALQFVPGGGAAAAALTVALASARPRRACARAALLDRLGTLLWRGTLLRLAGTLLRWVRLALAAARRLGSLPLLLDLGPLFLRGLSALGHPPHDPALRGLVFGPGLLLLDAPLQGLGTDVTLLQEVRLLTDLERVRDGPVHDEPSGER